MTLEVMDPHSFERATFNSDGSEERDYSDLGFKIDEVNIGERTELKMLGTETG